MGGISPQAAFEINQYKKVFAENFPGVDFDRYFDHLFGFNLTRFDSEVIKAPAGRSMRDTLQIQYGGKAVDLIARLIEFRDIGYVPETIDADEF